MEAGAAEQDGGSQGYSYRAKDRHVAFSPIGPGTDGPVSGSAYAGNRTVASASGLESRGPGGSGASARGGRNPYFTQIVWVDPEACAVQFPAKFRESNPNGFEAVRRHGRGGGVVVSPGRPRAIVHQHPDRRH